MENLKRVAFYKAALFLFKAIWYLNHGEFLNHHDLISLQLK